MPSQNGSVRVLLIRIERGVPVSDACGSDASAVTGATVLLKSEWFEALKSESPSNKQAHRPARRLAVCLMRIYAYRLMVSVERWGSQLNARTYPTGLSGSQACEQAIELDVLR